MNEVVKSGLDEKQQMVLAKLQEGYAKLEVKSVTNMVKMGIDQITDACMEVAAKEGKKADRGIFKIIMVICAMIMIPFAAYSEDNQ